jgi:hypothetical protein
MLRTGTGSLNSPETPRKTFQIKNSRPAYLRGAGQTRFTEDEARDFDAYLAFYLEDADVELTPGMYSIQQMIVATRAFPISSEEFKQTKLFCVSDIMIARLERAAGLPPLGSHQLSFAGLLARVLEQREESELNAGNTKLDVADGETPDQVVESDYAEPILKSDLAILFDVSGATISRRIKSGELRTLPGTSDRAKKVRIHGDDFPAGLKRPNERKAKLRQRPKS